MKPMAYLIYLYMQLPPASAIEWSNQYDLPTLLARLDRQW
jgi:hypothetical protein